MPATPDSSSEARRAGEIVFVTVGTTDFDSLLRATDEAAPRLGLPVEYQIGIGSYEPENGVWFRHAPSLDPYYDRARVVVAHGGAGTILEVLRRGIPLVCAENPDRPDRHQRDLISHMADQGRLIWCEELDRLDEAVAAARAMPRPEPLVTPPPLVHRVVGEFLDAIASKEDPRAVARRWRGRRLDPEKESE
jgi:UDP-N-acetylglucosamine transferase subunit ALG13